MVLHTEETGSEMIKCNISYDKQKLSSNYLIDMNSIKALFNILFNH